jgi:hypothetical protein
LYNFQESSQIHEEELWEAGTLEEFKAFVQIREKYLQKEDAFKAFPKSLKSVKDYSREQRTREILSNL